MKHMGPRAQLRNQSRNLAKKLSRFADTDPSGYNRAERRAGGIDINGNRVVGQRNQRPQRMAWPVTIEGKQYTLLAPLNRALKRATPGKTRG